MLEQSAVETPALTSLNEHLLQVTEALATSSTRDEVFHIVLCSALTALKASAGKVLLVGLAEQMQVAATAGDEAQTSWQDGLLHGDGPAATALAQHRTLFFEHQDALVGAAELCTTAVLPMFLGHRPLGVLTLDLKGPRTLTLEERQFLQILAAQTALALDRVQLLSRLQTSEASFQRVVEISPVGIGIGSLDGRLTLVNDAWLELLGQTRAAFEAGQIDWQALTPPEYAEIEQRAFDTVLKHGGTFNYDKEMLTPAGERVPFQATMARFDDQQVIGYAMDLRPFQAQSAWLARLVEERTSELQAEQLASRAFMTFTEAASHTTHVDDLARLALAVLQGVLPGSSVAFYELEGERWYARQLTADLSAELRAVLQGGLPPQTPSFAEMIETRAPVFIDQWDGEEDGVEHGSAYGRAALYPIFQGEVIGAALTLGLRGHDAWSAREHAAVLAVGRSFSLLYDRIAATQEAQLQRAEAESRNRALEAFSTLTGILDVRLDRYTLIRRTQEVVLPLLPPGYAAYFEPEHGLWRLKAQTGDSGSVALQTALEAGFPVGGTPTLDMAMNTGEPYFIDVYTQDTDIDPEIASHLNAAACLPIYVRKQFVGIFNIPLFHTLTWDATDRAVLISAVQSLMLALEGAQSLADLAQQSLELETSNESFQAANEELEAFTYSASHDLRTPVRHIMGFAQLAEEGIRKAEYEKVNRYLQVVKEGALRMDALINGMLVLSRSGRQELSMQPVDLNALVTQARRDAAAEFTGHPVRWQISDLPTVRGDQGMLQQVMTNLLSNAIKYSAKREVSEVRVWKEERGSEWTIHVQDNGVGFNPQYAQRLFGIFQRLHAEKDFKGTGVGLATMRRIVLKHGGQVFAESDGQTGATFSFTLPK